MIEKEETSLSTNKNYKFNHGFMQWLFYVCGPRETVCVYNLPSSRAKKGIYNYNN